MMLSTAHKPACVSRACYALYCAGASAAATRMCVQRPFNALKPAYSINTALAAFPPGSYQLCWDMTWKTEQASQGQVRAEFTQHVGMQG